MVNQGAISLAENFVLSESRHIELRQVFLSEKMEMRKITFLYMLTADSIDEMLTKPLEKSRMREHFKVMDL